MVCKNPLLVESLLGKIVHFMVRHLMEYVVTYKRKEIKCPYKKRTVSTCVKDGCIQMKIIFQMQLEMHCAGKSWGIIINQDYPYIYYNFSCPRQVEFHLIVSK